MTLYLRNVRHPQSRNSFRVILKIDGEEIEIGSIGVQVDVWRWGIDGVVPMGGFESEGTGSGRVDCMFKFRRAWMRFAVKKANFTDFLAAKRAQR
jgi:hypothetical protein